MILHILHDIIDVWTISCMISYMISLKKPWYHVWYHSYPFVWYLWNFIKIHDIINVYSFFHDIMLDITKNYYFTHSLRYHAMILPMITRQKSWIKAMISRLPDIIGIITLFHIWCGVISAYDIEIIWYHSPMMSPVSLISRHLSGKLVLVGGAMGQELRLLRPCRSQWTASSWSTTLAVRLESEPY